MLITRLDDLEEALAQLDDCEYIAFDTEFVRQTTFFPKLCLMQFSSGEKSFAVDIIELMAAETWPAANERILRFFSDTKAVIVMHAGEQDIEILNQQFAVPKMIFDTQVAARFIGFAGTPSYRVMVQHYFGISLDKELQFSRWDHRPLSPEHVEYAIKDVTYLYKLYPMVLEQLIKGGKMEWFVEDMVSLRTCTARADNIAELRVMIGSLKSLEEAEDCYAVLRAREATARTANVTKQRLLHLEGITACFINGSLDISKLNVIHRFKKQFMEAFAVAKTDVESYRVSVAEEWDNRFVARERKGDVFFAIKDLLAEVAKEAELPAELIASSKDIFKVLEKKPSKVSSGWRRELFGERAMKLL